jgi:hypothetical protein
MTPDELIEQAGDETGEYVIEPERGWIPVKGDLLVV